MSGFQDIKGTVLEYFQALEQAGVDTVQSVLQRYHAPDYSFLGVHPFNEQASSAGAAEAFWKPLLRSFLHLQRRQDVFIAGENEIDGSRWVLSMGHFMGLFDHDWLGVRASRKIAMLRYAEFNAVRDGKITGTGLWVDIIGFMQQQGLNPLPASTGDYFVYPGPRYHDGLLLEDAPPEEGAKTLSLLNIMINDLHLLNFSGDDECDPEYLARTWCENMSWFGPAGIGATHTIERYQEQHQFPFRRGLSDKTYNGHVCRFAEGNFGCFFGWPNLSHRTRGGFLGLPGGSSADMRVVDVYRREGDKLIENWIFIDIPYWLLQQGLDVIERTRSIENP
jgi:hypothetical protein